MAKRIGKYKVTKRDSAISLVDGGKAKGRLIVGGSRMSEILTNTDVDAQNNTLTAAQILGGIVTHTSVTGGGDVTLDTAVNIISGCNLTEDNEAIKCYYVNDGNQTLTLAVASGTTIADTGNTILTNEAAVLLIVRTSATAVKVYMTTS